uniref:Zinc finger ZPR1-type domain-containing protein n=1 Tax=Spongospora subterranea TaxID=70186 RepID=A0A0H5R9X9_9EUKA|eukprot:CRZ10601.1 hypothetical protein [Spongospora subterranea]
MPSCPVDYDENSRSGIDVGHQEVQRIIEELEAIYVMSHSEWLAAIPISSFICAQLGYEDIDELEDAIHGTFEEFLRILPQVQIKQSDDGEQERLLFRIIDQTGNPHKMVLKISERQQLWNVLLKSPTGVVQIPELEFEISADGRRRIDTIWGYLASSALDLEVRLQQRENDQHDDPDTVQELALLRQVVDGLSDLRDLKYEWTLVVSDESGATRFTDMSLVDIPN